MVIDLTNTNELEEKEDNERICSDIGHEWERIKIQHAGIDDYITFVEYMCIYCGITKQEFRLEENNNNNWRMGFFHFD